MTKGLKISIIISILYIGLIRLRPIWERYPGDLWNVLYFLAIAILFFWILTKIGIEIFRMIKKRKEFSFKLIIPILIMTTVILDGFYNPLKIDLDSIYGKTIFRACYEGTQNQATFKLRDSGKFDIHWTGVFFSDNFYTGKYIMKGDTIFMNYKTEIPDQLDDTLIIKHGYLCKLESDSLFSTYFYLGHCKGLN